MVATELVQKVTATVQQWSGIVVPPYREALVTSELLRLGDGALSVGAQRVLGGDPTARTALLHALSIPETYFFRHPGHFRALDALARARAAARQPFHALSAGAATGEEAWSIAAVLANAYQGSSARFSVTAVELDASRVAHATKGEYGGWSARQGLLEYSTYFSTQGTGNTARIRVHDSLRPFVTFTQGNLVEACLPAGARFDAVFFRNVAIYWLPALSREVVDRLAAVVHEDGFLALGPSDPVSLDPLEWTARYDGEARFHQRTRSLGQSAPRPTTPPSVTAGSWAVALPASEPTGLPRAAADVPRPAGPSTVSSPPSELEPVFSRVERLADTGHYQAALELLRAQVEAKGCGINALWEGIILFTLGQAQEAGLSLTRSVYLRPEDPAPRRWLALALAATGREADARREERNAQALEAAHV